MNPPESQATAESGATTAPTLPEDEHITLPDEIKDEIIIEEKYIQEETKETQQVIVTATVDEPNERLQPKPMKFETQHPHIRELNIKTPDEVADLPVHEEADIAVDDTLPAGSRKASLAKEEPQQIKTEIVKIEEKIIETEQIETQIIEQKSQSPEPKSPVDKKTPSPTGGKKIEDTLTKIESKISSSVAKVEYKVEELGDQFENTLKDVTGKMELIEQTSDDVKAKSPIDDVEEPEKEPSTSPEKEILDEQNEIDRNSASPVDVKEVIDVCKTPDDAEVIKEETKSASPQLEIDSERKDSVLDASDIQQEKSKTPSPELKVCDVTAEEIIKVSESVITETSETIVKCESDIATSEIDKNFIEEDVIEADKDHVSPVNELKTEQKGDETISKTPSPELKETSPTPSIDDKVELQRKESIVKATEIEHDEIQTKTPSPDLKEEKRASLVEKEIDKSKSPSPTADEHIVESRKQSDASKEAVDEPESKSASPVEKEANASSSPQPPKSVSPSKDDVILSERKDSIATDDIQQQKSSPTDLDVQATTPYTEVYDYSHPFDPQFPQELRETHITTVESPLVEKSKLIDLQVIDKTITETSEQDDLILNDIKEEDDEDRISPPRKESTDNLLSSAPLSVQIEPPRSVSPREQEVLKIVANVAEVLKSEKDISDIIPDFNEDELEKSLLQRASTPDVAFAIGQISRKGSGIDSEHKESTHDLSASLSETKTTSIDEKERHEVAEKHQTNVAQKDICGDFIEKERMESFIVEGQDESRRESAISAFSEKDYTKEESTLDRFSQPNSPVDLKHDDLDVKSIEIETHSEDITQIEKTKSPVHIEKPASTSPKQIDDYRKESPSDDVKVTDVKLEDDGPTVHRMLVTASSEDGGEETEICAKGMQFYCV